MPTTPFASGESVVDTKTFCTMREEKESKQATKSAGHFRVAYSRTLRLAVLM